MSGAPAEQPLAKGRAGGGDTSGTALVKALVAQASLVAALMFYLGAIYTGRFYGYFHLGPASLDFAFSHLALQSLHLLRLEVLTVGAVLVVVLLFARAGARERPPVRAAATVLAWLARLHLVFAVAGLVLLVLWQRIQPYGWVAPLTLAVGLLLGQSPTVRGGRPEGLWGRAVPVFAALLLLFWSLTLVAGHLGERDARDRARTVRRWPAVVVLSTQRLAIASPAVTYEQLGADLPHRHRYTGLRLLLERAGRYYVVPLDWQRRTDPIYVLKESENTWIALMPGVQPSR
ncbi:hypothetical protein [Streptomyces kanasensis]|uniref:hypothetical protein n=1 Tax=Streptomyces kanasensis TaxID=936756 RepID=UPI00381E3D7E